MPIPLGAAKKRGGEAAAEPMGRRVGRPLDETAEGRILEAGLLLYGQHGWRGTTMSAITREAGVGKALLYSRFAKPGDILEVAFERYVPELEGEFPTIRALLIAESIRMADLYLGRYSLALDRALLDANAGIDPFPRIVQGLGARTVLPMRRRIKAAVQSGELPPWTSVTLLLDIIEGAIRTHIMSASQVIDRVRAGIDAYVEQLVDEQLLLLSIVGEHRGYSGGQWRPHDVVKAGSALG